MDTTNQTQGMTVRTMLVGLRVTDPYRSRAFYQWPRRPVDPEVSSFHYLLSADRV